MQTVKTVAEKRGGNADVEPVILQKRIDSATYKVSVHFSKTSKETLEDKILRLIEREVTANVS